MMAAIVASTIPALDDRLSSATRYLGSYFHLSGNILLFIQNLALHDDPPSCTNQMTSRIWHICIIRSITLLVNLKMTPDADLKVLDLV